MNFHTRLKQTRIGAGISQVSAAAALGVARQTYLDLESGKTVPRIDTVSSLARLYGVSRTYLAWGNDKRLQAITEIESLLQELK